MIKEIVLAVGFAVISISDLITKEISMLMVMILGISGVIFQIYDGNLLSIDRLLGLIPGIALLFFARISEEKIGYGDGWMALVLGIYLSLEELMELGVIAITMSGVVALILITVFRKGMNYEIPFIPFMFAGYVFMRITL